MSVPRADPSNLGPVPVTRANNGTHSRAGTATAEADQQPPVIATPNGDALLLAVLALLNESGDMDGAVQQGLDMVTTALGGRIGEIWLASDDTRHVELRYSSSDGSAALAAFEAAGRTLAAGAVPALVAHVMKTGRASTVRLAANDAPAERAAEAAAVGIHTVLAFPIRTKSGVVGVLAVFRETIRGVLDAVPVACHHIGLFLERSRAREAVNDAVVELSGLASSDSLTG